MKIGQIFYIVGVIFLIAAILYFTWEYILHLGRMVKATIIFLLSLLFFFGASWLRGRDI